MKKKRQHIIPKCYQKAWCDPATPINQAPYIWMVSKDGKTKKCKGPENSFIENDVYTIRLPGGVRELVIEDTLMQIETKFVELLDHTVKKECTLEAQDKAILCVFASAMVSRVNPQARAFDTFMRELHGKIKQMEEQHGAAPHTSIETAAVLDNLRPSYVALSLPIVAPFYCAMSMAIFVAPEPDCFITSDSPTVWYNPESYKWPPFWRGPGLGQEKIEVTMPLTPKYALYLSHNEKINGYLPIPGHLVQELNRRTRFHCDEWFVSWQGEVRDYWFEQTPLPEDRWENSPEAKRAMAGDERQD